MTARLRESACRSKDRFVGRWYQRSARRGRGWQEESKMGRRLISEKSVVSRNQHVFSENQSTTIKNKKLDIGGLQHAKD